MTCDLLSSLQLNGIELRHLKMAKYQKIAHFIVFFSFYVIFSGERNIVERVLIAYFKA